MYKFQKFFAEITNREDENVLGVTYLGVYDTAVSEIIQDGKITDTHGRSNASCVPLLEIPTINESQSRIFGLLPAGVHRDTFAIPLASKFHDFIQYKINKSEKNLRLMNVSNNEETCFSISLEFISFLEVTNTLGIHFLTSIPEQVKIISVRPADSIHSHPAVAGTRSSVLDKKFKNALINTKAWEAKIPLPLSLYADRNDYCISYDTYGISSTGKRVATPQVEERCILCHRTEDISIEHCTPRWLAAALDIQPLTEKILCRSCNSDLGQKLELEINSAYKAGNLLRDLDAASRWGLKTAIMLAAAQNVHVPRRLSDAVLNEDPHLGGAFVLHCKITTIDVASRFQFTVSRFGTDPRKVNRFMLQFMFDNYLFIICLWDNLSRDEIIQIFVAELKNYQVAASPSQSLFHILLERFSGHALDFDERDMTQKVGPPPQKR